MQKVSVAVLNWNGKKHLEVLLPALRELQDPGIDHEILVLDNGSSDDLPTSSGFGSLCLNH